MKGVAEVRQRERPGPVRWVRYAVGGQLPARYQSWVFHDLTSRTWVLRHTARSLVLILPLMLVWLLLPGPLWVRFLLVLMAGLVGFFYSFAYIEESCEHRLSKHGYPHGMGKRVRREAREARDAAKLEVRRQKARARKR